MEPEKKKQMLYIGGAVASIAALFLYMKSRASAQAASANSGYGGMPLSGAGGGSGSSSADQATIQAQIAATLAQSSQQTQVQVAEINSQTALGVVNIEAAALASGNKAKLISSIATAPGAIGGATDLGKGLIGLVGGAIKGITSLFTPASDSVKSSTLPTGAGTASAMEALSFAPGGSLTGSDWGFGDFTSYVPPAAYNEVGNIVDLTTKSSNPTFFQGSIGSGDSGWFGSIPSETYTNPPEINPFGAGMFV
jgi:hypothetical protein